MSVASTGKELTEIETVPAVIEVPEETVYLTITAKVMNENGKLYTAESTLNASDIRDCIAKGEEWEMDHATYAITEEGKAWLRELEKEGKI